MRNKSHIISIEIDNLSFEDSLHKATDWGMKRTKGFICFANSHMTVLAHKRPEFKSALSKAALILPDGKPLAIACSLLYKRKQERVAGMDFMPALLDNIGKHKASIFLFGSTPLVLDNLTKRIHVLYPEVKIVGTISPSFHGVSEVEKRNHIDEINQSGANFVFVALGCPKQEIWMAENWTSINALLLGVGGAFPVVAGIQKRSPKLMQSLSLEWLYRLGQEPKRLFKRYLYTNISFLFLLTVQLAKNFRTSKKLLRSPGGISLDNSTPTKSR